jgi:hypothetical protein
MAGAVSKRRSLKESRSCPNIAQTATAPAGRPRSHRKLHWRVDRMARDIRVETDNYIALFTTQGARLKSFQFKNYRASARQKSTL